MQSATQKFLIFCCFFLLNYCSENSGKRKPEVTSVLTLISSANEEAVAHFAAPRLPQSPQFP